LFCNIAGVGLDSAANQRANRMPRWVRSHGGYVLAALLTIPAYKPQMIEIESRESEFTTKLREPAFMIAVANTPSYGGGMQIAPRAEMDDGKLEVCLVRATSRLRLLRLFPMVFRGAHLNLREVAYFQSEGLRISTARPSAVYADGEFVYETPIEIGVKRQVLRVISAARRISSSQC
jgi:diacylglycerol kinase (ATP)